VGEDAEAHQAQWWARRLGFVRGFAQYRSLFDPATEIPPAQLLGSARSRCTPHIYSEAEIVALLSAAAALGPKGGLRPHTYVALLGLLASSGLRISEALHLTNADVDLDAGILTIIQTKFRKSRLVPLHLTAALALRRYVERRDRYCPRLPAKTFFLHENGAPVGYGAVKKAFDILRRQLGWTKGPNGRRPRIHDLRHAMAVRRLLRWYQEGADVGCKIAALATYLGHVEVTDTYWYLTAVPELMALGSTRFESYVAAIGGRNE